MTLTTGVLIAAATLGGFLFVAIVVFLWALATAQRGDVNYQRERRR